MTIFATATWWFVLLLGLGTSGWFLAWYWPRRWREAPAVIIRGLVLAIFLEYARPVVSLALVGGTPSFRGGTPQTIFNYVVVVFTDVVLLILMRLYRRYRTAYMAEMDRTPDES